MMWRKSQQLVNFYTVQRESKLLLATTSCLGVAFWAKGKQLLRATKRFRFSAYFEQTITLGEKSTAQVAGGTPCVERNMNSPLKFKVGNDEHLDEKRLVWKKLHHPRVSLAWTRFSKADRGASPRSPRGTTGLLVECSSQTTSMGDQVGANNWGSQRLRGGARPTCKEGGQYAGKADTIITSSKSRYFMQHNRFVYLDHFTD